MARRNTLRLDLSGFNELITKLESLDGDVKGAVTEAMEQAGQTIHDDTVAAMKDEYLPAKGKFHHHGNPTEKSIVTTTVEWDGTTAIAPVGFDYGEKGAGGLLISGTPRMAPNRQLEQIYTRKKYMTQLQKDMQKVVTDYIKKTMEK